MGFDQLQANGNPNIAGFYSTSAPMGLESQQALQAQQIMGQQGLLAANNRNEQQKYQVMMQMAQQEQAAKAQQAQQLFLQQRAQQQYVAQQLAKAGVNPNLANAASSANADNNQLIGKLTDPVLAQQKQQATNTYLRSLPEAVRTNPVVGLLGLSNNTGASLGDLGKTTYDFAQIPVNQTNAQANLMGSQAQMTNADVNKFRAPAQNQLDINNALKAFAESQGINYDNMSKDARIQLFIDIQSGKFSPAEGLTQGAILPGGPAPLTEGQAKALQGIPNQNQRNTKAAEATRQQQAFDQFGNAVQQPINSAVNWLGQLFNNQNPQQPLPNSVNPYLLK